MYIRWLLEEEILWKVILVFEVVNRRGDAETDDGEENRALELAVEEDVRKRPRRALNSKRVSIRCTVVQKHLAVLQADEVVQLAPELVRALGKHRPQDGLQRRFTWGGGRRETGRHT